MAVGPETQLGTLLTTWRTKLDPNMTRAFEVITSTAECLSYPHRSPSSLRRRHIPPPCSKSPLPAESLETPDKTRRQKRERDPSPLSRAVVAGADDAACRQRRSSPSALPQERQHSNHPNRRVKRSADADISESTDGTLRRSSFVLAGGWFRQRDQNRQRPPVFER